ncbi:MAG: nitrilase-related carbon-nitrogen hydrolase [Pseudomonadota bacterium]
MTTIKAALVVQNCLVGQYDKNIDSSLQLIDQAIKKNADFIVFPEMNLTGYVAGSKIKHISKPVDLKIITLFSDICKKNNVTVLIGLAEKKDNSDIYASHLVFSPSGLIGTYRKIHTAPNEKKYFCAGDIIPVFQSHGLIFGIQLCYDAHFPELSTAMATKNVDIIFLPHASPRGTAQDKYDSWIRHLRARAYDNGVFIAACNQVGDNAGNLDFPGVSIFIGPDGNVISKSLSTDQTIHVIDIDKNKLDKIRSHKMRYFLPNRRADLFPQG